jgi:Holliday junction resolvase RusA-like endonuclease
MTKTGYNDKIVKNLLTFTIYIPLIAVGIYGFSQIYDFIYLPDGPVDSNPKTSTAEYIKTSAFNELISIFGKVASVFGYVFGKLKSMLLDFKSLVMVGFILYILLSYYFAFLRKDGAVLEDWSKYTNILIILIGAFLALGVFSLFLKNNFEPNVKKANETFEKNSFLNKIKWMFTESVPLYKTVIGISIVLGLSILLLFLIAKFEFLSLTMTTLIGIIAIMGLIFSLFRLITGNTKWMSAISGNIILKILYHLVFIVPCSVMYLTHFVWTQLKDTPKVTWVILLIEILTVGMYFFIPWFNNYWFIHSVTKKDELMLQQESLGNDKSIIANENELSTLMNGISVDWDLIMKQDLYIPKNNINLKVYLESRGYTSGKINKKLSFFQRFTKKDLSLEAAITYVQSNAPIIINLKTQIYMQLLRSKNLSKTRSDKDNMFKTRILLKDAIYLNKKKIIGNYEDVGSAVGAFNYNYSISAWFFLHEQGPNLRESSLKFTNILDYANKPKIQFNSKENKLRITMSNGLDKEHVVYKMNDFPLQRWNNIVVNYNGGTLDIFVNGKLVSSTGNIVPIMSYDEITVGADKGVSGGVCNVVYFPKPLTLPHIKKMYKQLRYKNPPIL